MTNRPRKAIIPVGHPREAVPIRIVGDAGIANPTVGEGRLIPLVILDTSERPDFEEFIRLHQFVPSGDVHTQWGQAEGRANSVHLILRFERPLAFTAIVEFDLMRHQGLLVEQVLATKALYLQSGREGDRLRHDLEKPKVIIEVPDSGFVSGWSEIYRKHVEAKMRAEGLDRASSKRAARQFLEETRRLAREARVPTGN